MDYAKKGLLWIKSTIIRLLDFVWNLRKYVRTLRCGDILLNQVIMELPNPLSQTQNPVPLKIYQFPQSTRPRTLPKVAEHRINLLKAWAASEKGSKEFCDFRFVKYQTFDKTIRRTFYRLSGLFITDKVIIAKWLIRNGHMTIMEFLENNPGKMLIV